MIVDVIVGAVLLISAIIAFLRGFIREVLTILGVVGGLVAAYAGAPHLSTYVDQWLGVEEGVEPERLFGIIPYTLLGDILSYGSIFIVVVIVLSVISHFLAEAVKSVGLGAIDRTLGVIFGIARGAILLGLLYLPIHLLVDADTKNEWFAGSRTYIYLEQTATYMTELLPEQTIRKFEEDTEKLEESVSTAREKLQDIDVLQKDPEEKQTEPTDKKKDGYTDEFRNQMDQLFELETEEEP